jgi:S-adenosylmethionine:tRNA ribosyltransferase-isomerase
MFTLDQFNYTLPDELIAHSPAVPRDSSRLLIVDRRTGKLSHHHFSDLPNFLGKNDVIVRNNTKVIPARIFGRKAVTGGQCEILLIKHLSFTDTGTQWECLAKPGLKVCQQILFEKSSLEATCVSITGYTRTLEFNRKGEAFYQELDKIGHTPVPPYIHWQEEDELKLREIYQTTFAKFNGSAAAPTAGLHFTPELDQKLREKGVQIEEITLHVGLGTFLPVQDEQIKEKKLHEEIFEVTTETAERLNADKKARKRIIAVGTTTTRTLETRSDENGQLIPGSGQTDLFIQPGYKFKFVDSMITNFHLPKSSLLMLISTFVSAPNTSQEFSDFSRSLVGTAYQEAIQEKYRFFSFGDAMLIQ